MQVESKWNSPGVCVEAISVDEPDKSGDCTSTQGRALVLATFMSCMSREKMVAFEYASGRRQAASVAMTINIRTENIRVVVEDCVVVGGVKTICSHALCRPGLGGCVIDVDGGGVRAVRVEDIDRVRELRDSSAM